MFNAILPSSFNTLYASVNHSLVNLRYSSNSTSSLCTSYPIPTPYGQLVTIKSIQPSGSLAISSIQSPLIIFPVSIIYFHLCGIPTVHLSLLVRYLNLRTPHFVHRRVILQYYNNRILVRLQ